MFVLALSLYNTWNRGVFLLCKITNLLIYSIIICKDKKDAIVEMTLPKDSNQIFASKYETVLPSKEELQTVLEDKNFE